MQSSGSESLLKRQLDKLVAENLEVVQASESQRQELRKVTQDYIDAKQQLEHAQTQLKEQKALLERLQEEYDCRRQTYVQQSERELNKLRESYEGVELAMKQREAEVCKLSVQLTNIAGWLGEEGKTAAIHANIEQQYNLITDLQQEIKELKEHPAQDQAEESSVSLSTPAIMEPNPSEEAPMRLSKACSAKSIENLTKEDTVTLQELEDALINTKDEVDALCLLLQKKNEEFQELKHDLDLKEHYCRKLEAEVTEHLKKGEATDKKLKELLFVVQDSKEMNENQMAELARCETEISALRSENMVMEAELQNMDQCYSCQLEQVESALGQAEFDRDEAWRELQQFELLIQRMQIDFDARMEIFDAELEMKAHESEQLRMQLSTKEAEIGLISDELLEARGDQVRLQHFNGLLKQKLSMLTAENDELRGRLVALAEHSASIQTQLRLKDAEIVEVRKLVDFYSSALSDEQENTAKAVRGVYLEARQARDETKVLQVENARLESEVVRLRDQNEHMILQSDKSGLETELGNAKAAISALRAENHALKIKNEELTTAMRETPTASQRIQLLSEEIADLRTRRAQTNMEVVRLQGSESRLFRSVDRLQAQITSMSGDESGEGQADATSRAVVPINNTNTPSNPPAAPKTHEMRIASLLIRLLTFGLVGGNGKVSQNLGAKPRKSNIKSRHQKQDVVHLTGKPDSAM